MWQCFFYSPGKSVMWCKDKGLSGLRYWKQTGVLAEKTPANAFYQVRHLWQHRSSVCLGTGKTVARMPSDHPRKITYFFKLWWFGLNLELAKSRFSSDESDGKSCGKIWFGMLLVPRKVWLSICPKDSWQQMLVIGGYQQWSPQSHRQSWFVRMHTRHTIQWRDLTGVYIQFFAIKRHAVENFG